MDIFLVIDCTQCFTNPNGWITLIIGSVISAIIPFLLYTMKPNLKICTPSLDHDIDKKHITIPIENIGCKNAVNLKIEVCVVKIKEENEGTFHLEIDKDNFIVLPTKNKNIKEYNKREFKSKNSTNTLVRLIQAPEIYYLRVRVHANHEYSGFGKAFEAIFIYKNGVFENIGNKNICNKFKK